MQVIVQHWQEIVAGWIILNFLLAPVMGGFAGFNDRPLSRKEEKKMQSFGTTLVMNA